MLSLLPPRTNTFQPPKSISVLFVIFLYFSFITFLSSRGLPGCAVLCCAGPETAAWTQEEETKFPFNILGSFFVLFIIRNCFASHLSFLFSSHGVSRALPSVLTLSRGIRIWPGVRFPQSLQNPALHVEIMSSGDKVKGNNLNFPRKLHRVTALPNFRDSDNPRQATGVNSELDNKHCNPRLEFTRERFFTSSNLLSPLDAEIARAEKMQISALKMEIDTRLSATILIKRRGWSSWGEDNKCLLVGELMMLKMNSLHALAPEVVISRSSFQFVCAYAQFAHPSRRTFSQSASPL